MMMQPLSPWHQSLFAQWQTFINTKRIPQALLICGAQGLGKSQLVKAMLAVLWCEAAQALGACGVCRHCYWLAQDAHPDCTWLKPEGLSQTIKIDVIRQSSEWLQLSPLTTQHKVLVIQSAENLNLAASNALLKTLEEPPSSGLIILISEMIEQLLPTIRSRCYKLTLPLPDETFNRTWLQQQTKNEMPRFLPQGLGPYALLAELSPAQTEIREKIILIMEQLYTKKLHFVLAAEKLKEINAEEILRYSYFFMQNKIAECHARHDLPGIKPWLEFERCWLNVKRSLLQNANLNWPLQLELLLAKGVAH